MGESIFIVGFALSPLQAHVRVLSKLTLEPHLAQVRAGASLPRGTPASFLVPRAPAQVLPRRRARAQRLGRGRPAAPSVSKHLGPAVAAASLGG